MNLRKQVKLWLYGSCPGFAGSFPYFGARVHFPPGSKSFIAACQQGVYESDIVNLLRQLVRPDTFLFDVGANIGLMAIPVLHAQPLAKVVSFEPSPSSTSFLRKTIARNGFEGRWQLVEKALSDAQGSVEFAIGRPEDSLFEGIRSGLRIAGSTVINVPASTADDEWERLGRPSVSVLKVDVEGAEMQVLRGAHRLLESCRPHIVLEWHEPFLKEFNTRPEELLTIANRFGYGVFSVPAGIPVESPRALTVQMLQVSNFLLMP